MRRLVCRLFGHAYTIYPYQATGGRHKCRRCGRRWPSFR